MTTLVTNSELSSGGIVVLGSSMNIEQSGLAVVEAQFAYRTSDSIKFRRSFLKGGKPPVALTRLDLGQLQTGSVYLTQCQFEDQYGITKVSATYAGARSINVNELFVSISSQIRAVTVNIGGDSTTIAGSPASYSVVQREYGGPNQRVIGTVSEAQVQAASRGGRLRMPVNQNLRYNPARPSKTVTSPSRTLLDAYFNVYEYAYNFALVDGVAMPRIAHSISDLVKLAGGKSPTRTGLGAWTPVINEQIERVNSRVMVYRKIFTAEKTF